MHKSDIVVFGQVGYSESLYFSSLKEEKPLLSRLTLVQLNELHLRVESAYTRITPATDCHDNPESSHQTEKQLC